MQRLFIMENMRRYNTEKLTPGQKTFMIVFPVLCFITGLCVGRLSILPMEVFKAVLARFGMNVSVSEQINTVIWSMRMPRLILACLVGSGLSVSGCVFQGRFSNPLATPDTLGVASGASFGAAVALLLGFRMTGVQITALIFGVIAVFLTGLAGIGLNEGKSVPILAGIMVSSMFSSLVSLVKFAADTESQLPAITYWLMGSLESAGYSSLMLGAPPIIIGIIIILLLRWRMNLLPLTEDEAISSGVNIRRLRLVTEFCATMITASCVSMCGQVGWVGLIVPHICRMRYGSNYKVLIPASVCIGAGFMMIVDTIARTVSPMEIPISILTAIVGAPFFVFLLRKNRGWTL
ncbi:MAG TPA: iron ABC transporter permease [Parasegetibacter sp.]